MRSIVIGGMMLFDIASERLIRTHRWQHICPCTCRVASLAHAGAAEAFRELSAQSTGSDTGGLLAGAAELPKRAGDLMAGDGIVPDMDGSAKRQRT